MTINTQEAVIAKISKLLNLAENTSANPNEAAVAVARTQELMDKYKIEQEIIDIDRSTSVSEPEEELENRQIWRGKYSFSSWRWLLANGLANLNSCGCFTIGRSVYYTVGMPSDIAVVQYLFAYVTQEIERLTKQALTRKEIHGKTGSNNFRIGAIYAVLDKVKEQKTETKQEFLRRDKKNSQAIIRVERKEIIKQQKVKTYMDEHVTHRFGRIKRTADREAFASGYQEGKKIGINAGLKAGKISKQLGEKS